MSKKSKTLVSIVLVTLMLMSVFVGDVSAAANPGKLSVSPTSWNPAIYIGDSKDKEFSVKNVGSDIYESYVPEVVVHPESLKGVKLEKISGPDWLTFATPTDLGDIPAKQSRKFILRASPPEDVEGTFSYRIRVSCTSGEPSYIDIEGEITVSPPPTSPGRLSVSPTSWNPTIYIGDSKDKEFSVKNVGSDIYESYVPEVVAHPESLKGVKLEKISGPDWLTFATPTDLGDIPAKQSRKFTIVASPPADTEGSLPYKIRVSCTSGEPSYIDITGKITVTPLVTAPTATPRPTPTPVEKGVPGFEALFAIAGFLAVSYLLKRRK